MSKENNAATKPFYNSTIPLDWNIPEFSDVFSFLKSFSFSREQLTDKKTVDEIQNIHYGDIHATYENEILDFEIEQRIPFLKTGLFDIKEFTDKEFSALVDGDLIIADASEDYKGVCNCVELKNVNGRKVISGLHTFAARGNIEEIAFGFRTYALNNQQVVRELRRIATGTSVYGVSKKNLSKVKLPLPPLPEQRFIAHFLGLMDSAINHNNKLMAQKVLQKKWLMQNLLTGRRRIQKYVKNKQHQKTTLGELPVDWKLKTLKSILNPVRKSLVPEQSEMYQQIGIRSHTKGIFYKEKVSGAELGEKSVFWIEPDCFIVNIVFAWEHAIAKTTEHEIGMIASHRFPMFKPKEGVMNLDYLLYFFKSLRGKHLLGLASPGGAGRNKTLGQSEFVKLQIPVPSIEEQTAIAQVLQAADKEIQLLKTKTEKLRGQKKGMMQVLLTGKKD
jgi:type I restriction enzyme S subunit